VLARGELRPAHLKAVRPVSRSMNRASNW
jgi:hypothetical protein